jgi:hypothetical protein
MVAFLRPGRAPRRRRGRNHCAYEPPLRTQCPGLRLKKEGILRETDQGLIVTEANQFKFGNNHELQKTNILLVRKFLRDLTEAGIELPGGI